MFICIHYAFNELLQLYETYDYTYCTSYQVWFMMLKHILVILQSGYNPMTSIEPVRVEFRGRTFYFNDTQYWNAPQISRYLFHIDIL